MARSRTASLFYLRSRSGAQTALHPLDQIYDPLSAQDIRNALGINTDGADITTVYAGDGSGNVQYSNIDTWLDRLDLAGVTHIRAPYIPGDGANYISVGLRARGMQWVMVVVPDALDKPTNATPTQTRAVIDDIYTNAADVCLAIEGINEPNQNKSYLHTDGRTYSDPVPGDWAYHATYGAVTHQQAIYSQVHLSGRTWPNGYPTIISPSLHDSANQSSYSVGALATAGGVSASQVLPKDSVATVSALPTSGNTAGDTRAIGSTGANYIWNGSAWKGPVTVSGGVKHYNQMTRKSVTSYMNVVGVKTYPSLGNVPTAGLSTRLSFVDSAFAPDYPVWATEWGYCTSPSAPVTARITETAEGIYAPRALLQFFGGLSQGRPTPRNIRLCAFEALDNYDPSGSQATVADHYGWWRVSQTSAVNSFNPSTWTPKPIVDSMTALLAALGEPDGPDYNPDPIKLFIDDGGVADVQRLVVSKRDGSSIVFVWRNVSVMDTTTKTDLAVVPVPVTITDIDSQITLSVDGRVQWVAVDGAPVPKPKPPPSIMKFGTTLFGQAYSRYKSRTLSTDAAKYNAVESDTASVVNGAYQRGGAVVRVYGPNYPGIWNTDAKPPAVRDGQAIIYSFKAGTEGQTTFKANLRAFLDSKPITSEFMWFCFWHEPDDNIFKTDASSTFPGMSSTDVNGKLTWWLDRNRWCREVISEPAYSTRTDFRFGCIFTGEPFATYTATSDPRSWKSFYDAMNANRGGTDTWDYMGADRYNPNWNDPTMFVPVTNWLQRADECHAGTGLPIVIGEAGTPRPKSSATTGYTYAQLDQMRTDWITSLYTAIRDRGYFDAVCWWRVPALSGFSDDFSTIMATPTGYDAQLAAQSITGPAGGFDAQVYVDACSAFMVGSIAQANTLGVGPHTLSFYNTGLVPGQILVGWDAPITWNGQTGAASNGGSANADHEHFKVLMATGTTNWWGSTDATTIPGGLPRKTPHFRKMFQSGGFITPKNLLANLADADADGYYLFQTTKVPVRPGGTAVNQDYDWLGVVNGDYDSILAQYAQIAQDRMAAGKRPFGLSLWHEPHNDYTLGSSTLPVPPATQALWCSMHKHCSYYFAGKRGGTSGSAYNSGYDVRAGINYGPDINGFLYTSQQAEVNVLIDATLITALNANGGLVNADIYDGGFSGGATLDRINDLVTWARAKGVNSLGIPEFAANTASDMNACWAAIKANLDLFRYAAWWTSGVGPVSGSPPDWRLIPNGYPHEPSGVSGHFVGAGTAATQALLTAWQAIVAESEQLGT